MQMLFSLKRNVVVGLGGHSIMAGMIINAPEQSAKE